MNDSRLGEEAHAEEIARLAVDTDGVNLGEHIEEAIEVIEAEEAGDAEILGRRGDGNPTTVILREAGERDAERGFVEDNFSLAPREGIRDASVSEGNAGDAAGGGCEVLAGGEG